MTIFFTAVLTVPPYLLKQHPDIITHAPLQLQLQCVPYNNGLTQVFCSMHLGHGYGAAWNGCCRQEATSSWTCILHECSTKEEKPFLLLASVPLSSCYSQNSVLEYTRFHWSIVKKTKHGNLALAAGHNVRGSVQCHFSSTTCAPHCSFAFSWMRVALQVTADALD